MECKFPVVCILPITEWSSPRIPIAPTTERNGFFFFARAEAPSSSSSSPEEKVEIKVCCNRSCRRQGCRDILAVLSGIAPPRVSVASCGCLGRCGAGPNLVILPEGVVYGHCGTPRKAAEVMSAVADLRVDECLEALALRKRAEDERDRGDFGAACSLLTQALDLHPVGNIHKIYKERSTIRLRMGDVDGALDDAREATALAPEDPEPYICRGDALMAKGELRDSEDCYSMALRLDPSIARSRTFKARISKLVEELQLETHNSSV